MKLTKQFLTKNEACSDGVEWAIENKQIGLSGVAVLNKLIENKKLDWANWFIVRIMSRKQKLKYAIFAAEQVIEIYEKEYPKDDRPRKAIEAAKEVLKKDTKANRDAAYAASAASNAASNAAYAASDAASAASYAASYAASAASNAASAAYAAYAASAASNAASNAASAASNAASNAAYATYDTAMKTKILKYGVLLLK